MTFGKAIEHLKTGNMVSRSGWNGKNMHIYLEDASDFKFGAGVFKGQTRHYEPYLVLVNAQGNHQSGWNASTPDVLADDWGLVPKGA